jgi:TPR repeat protein
LPKVAQARRQDYLCEETIMRTDVMSLLPRLRRGKDPETEALQERVSHLQTALQQCAEVAQRWTTFQRGVSLGLAVSLLTAGFTLGVYRDQIKTAGTTLVQAVGLAATPNFAAADAAYRDAEYAKALDLVRPLAAAGDARAQALLGVMHYRGRGVAQDYGEAVTWFRRAADQNDVAGLFYLGFMYSEGQGVPQDFAESAKWFRLAAERGDAGSQYNLALSYAKGETGQPDNVSAYMWFNLAAARFPASDTRRNAAITNRDSLAGKMTAAELAEAQKRAREWKPK